MATGTLDKTLHVGQLIKLYELYADGYLTKDYGYGIILDVNKHIYADYTNYKVCRYKHGDIMLFGKNELEEVEK